MGLDTTPLFLGIDGGGTRCRARLRSASGQWLGEGVGGAANARLEPASVRASILDATHAALAQAGLTAQDAARIHAGLGLAGAGQPTARERLLAQAFPFASIALDTDAYAAWLGASLDGRDAILIVGTGVCGFMVRDGQHLPIGGWGSIVSDDGGGAVTGREAVRLALRAYDGTAPQGPLSQAILAAIGPSPEAIVDWADKATPADFAGFAPWVYRYADEGDTQAGAIAGQAAEAIDRLTLRLVALGASSVHLLGGLASVLLPRLNTEARRHFTPARADALEGALILAQDHHARKSLASGVQG